MVDKWFWPPFCISLIILAVFGTVVSFATWHWAKQSVAAQNEVMRRLMEREANVKCRKILREALENRTEEVIQVAKREMQRLLDEECPGRKRREIGPSLLLYERLSYERLPYERLSYERLSASPGFEDGDEGGV
ncbi:uncharacterized protein LOC119587678 [Penaeus monodon]|uniref:uncharacterized protein LOC119587678 n=1 Tax=Penaeus monodon TaxID=6687 RepID=UPI0018A7B8CB|nr:uncharacterized protein LOC119587678 [Penaeus monodon]